MSTSAQFKNRILSGSPTLAPGAANALAARIIEDLDFEAIYVTGAGIANSFLGAPDIGLVTLSEVADHVSAIRDAVSIPLIVDADTGFGNAINVQRTMRILERAGANAIQIEDQIAPKKCGHFAGKGVVELSEMVGKIHAAVDARADESTMVIARTDAAAVHGLEDAIERAMAYAEAGADVLFIEAPTNRDDLLRLPGLVAMPQVANMVEGGRTPLLTLDELSEFSIVLYANVALQAAIFGMTRVLSSLKNTGDLRASLDELAPWAQRQATVRKAKFDALEVRYAASARE